MNAEQTPDNPGSMTPLEHMKEEAERPNTYVPPATTDGKSPQSAFRDATPALTHFNDLIENLSAIDTQGYARTKMLPDIDLFPELRIAREQRELLQAGLDAQRETLKVVQAQEGAAVERDRRDRIRFMWHTVLMAGALLMGAVAAVASVIAVWVTINGR